MNSRTKCGTGVYVPPARRNQEKRTNGGTEKQNEEGISREIPPNCCEDEEEIEATSSPLQENSLSSVVSLSPVTSSDSSSMDRRKRDTSPNAAKDLNYDLSPVLSSGSSSMDWRRRDTPQNIAKDFQKKVKVGRQHHNNDRIPVKQKVIVSNNEVRQDEDSNDSVSSRNGFGSNSESSYRSEQYETLLDTFHQSNVPYIDSHCHTDFMFTVLNRHKTPKNHQGINNWVEKYPRAFPKSFSGFIANFIKPDLFTDAPQSGQEFDLNWILKELNSDYYLGTTWGCHPHQATKWGRNGFFWTMMKYLMERKETFKVLAIGECGVDLHRCESKLEDQRFTFMKHIEMAFVYELPLVVHCRSGGKGDAEGECLKILKEQMDKNHKFLKIHRHCFTETWEVAKMWLEQCRDVHFGFTAAIFSFKENQIEAVRRIPLDRILLETDGPYFKPKCFDGIAPSKICLPGMAIATAARIAEIKNVSLDEVLRATYNNTRRVYQIPIYLDDKKSQPEVKKDQTAIKMVEYPFP